MNWYNIRILGLATNASWPRGVYWLKAYDPEANDGRGDVRLTQDRAQAMSFRDAKAALDAYRAVPTCHPVRATDGKPNRPLTAYTIEIVASYAEPTP